MESKDVLKDFHTIKQRFNQIEQLVNDGCEAQAVEELGQLKCLLDDIIAHLMAFEYRDFMS